MILVRSISRYNADENNEGIALGWEISHFHEATAFHDFILTFILYYNNDMKEDSLKNHHFVLLAKWDDIVLFLIESVAESSGILALFGL